MHHCYILCTLLELIWNLNISKTQKYADLDHLPNPVFYHWTSTYQTATTWTAISSMEIQALFVPEIRTRTPCVLET